MYASDAETYSFITRFIQRPKKTCDRRGAFVCRFDLQAKILGFVAPKYVVDRREFGPDLGAVGVNQAIRDRKRFVFLLSQLPVRVVNVANDQQRYRIGGSYFL